MPPLEEYLQRVDELLGEVISAYGSKPSKSTADNHRQHGLLSHQVEAEEQAAKRAFAEAYKAFYEKHAATS